MYTSWGCSSVNIIHLHFPDWLDTLKMILIKLYCLKMPCMAANWNVKNLANETLHLHLRRIAPAHCLFQIQSHWAHFMGAIHMCVYVKAADSTCSSGGTPTLWQKVSVVLSAVAHFSHRPRWLPVALTPVTWPLATDGHVYDKGSSSDASKQWSALSHRGRKRKKWYLLWFRH